MLKLLSIDTSTDYLSIAVTRDTKVLAKVHKKVPMMHSSLLVPMIAKLLGKAKIRPSDLDGFCISAGPGSFTGLRIGFTTVKGLAYSCGKDIASVPTLDVIAHNVLAHKGIICPILDARKDKVYACLYKSDGKNIKRISGYLLTKLEDLLEMLKKYDDVAIFGNMAGHPSLQGYGIKLRDDWHPKASVVFKLGLALFKKRKTVNAKDLEPMYLYSRECDIKGY